MFPAYSKKLKERDIGASRYFQQHMIKKWREQTFQHVMLWKFPYNLFFGLKQDGSVHLLNPVKSLKEISKNDNDYYQYYQLIQNFLKNKKKFLKVWFFAPYIVGLEKNSSTLIIKNSGIERIKKWENDQQGKFELLKKDDDDNTTLIEIKIKQEQILNFFVIINSSKEEIEILTQTRTNYFLLSCYKEPFSATDYRVSISETKDKHLQKVICENNFYGRVDSTDFYGFYVLTNEGKIKNVCTNAGSREERDLSYFPGGSGIKDFFIYNKTLFYQAKKNHWYRNPNNTELTEQGVIKLAFGRVFVLDKNNYILYERDHPLEKSKASYTNFWDEIKKSLTSEELKEDTIATFDTNGKNKMILYTQSTKKVLIICYIEEQGPKCEGVFDENAILEIRKNEWQVHILLKSGVSKTFDLDIEKDSNF